MAELLFCMYIFLVCLSTVESLQHKRKLTQGEENSPAEVISLPVQAVGEHQ